MKELFPPGPSVIDWRRRCERVEAESERWRALSVASEKALLELLALITMNGELRWSADMADTHPVAQAVNQAGEVLDELRSALGLE